MYGWGKGRNHVLLVGSVLRVLDDANKLGGELVPYTELQNGAVSAAVLESLQAEWLAWQKVKQGLSQWGAAEALPQSLCQLPFLMTAECKKMILQGEGSALMHAEVQNSFQRAIHMMRQGAVRPALHAHPGVVRATFCPSPCAVMIGRCLCAADTVGVCKLFRRQLRRPHRSSCTRR